MPEIKLPKLTIRSGETFTVSYDSFTEPPTATLTTPDGRTCPCAIAIGDDGWVTISALLKLQTKAPEFRELTGEVARENGQWVYTQKFYVADEEREELHDLVNDGIRDAREAIEKAGYVIDEETTDSDTDSIWVFFKEKT